MIYLDNAATTPVLPEVAEAINETILSNFGNPSSTHQIGRKAKSAIEIVRKQIAKQFNVEPSQIIFNSGGTEGNNFILRNVVKNLKIKHIISSKIEHHAVLHVIEELSKEYPLKISYVNLNDFGAIDLQHLEELLQNSEEKTLVSLMMVNNEIGNLLPIKEVSKLCTTYGALFHSDTVQAIGHYKLDLQEIPVDFITCSGHKFHATKGVGFMYVKKGISLRPLSYGGGQEKGLRPSTENVPAIVGLGKAIEIAYSTLEDDKNYILELKDFFISALQKIDNTIKFNGLSSDLEKSSYTILNVQFPIKDPMFLFNLDIQGIAVSGGSACQSGANSGSHVLNEILDKNALQKTSIRFSFSKLTTKKELLETIEILKKLISK